MSEQASPDRLGLRLKVLQDNLASISERLDSAVRLLSAISSLTQIPLRGRGLNQAAEDMLGILVRSQDNIMNCSLMLYAADCGQLRILAVRGQAEFFGESVPGGSQHLTFRAGEGIAGRVFAEGQPIFWSETSTQPAQLKVFADSDIPAAIACLPLPSQEGCLGVVNLSFSDPLDFTFTEQRNLILLSQVVANVLHHVILQERLAAK